MLPASLNIDPSAVVPRLQDKVIPLGGVSVYFEQTFTSKAWSIGRMGLGFNFTSCIVHVWHVAWPHLQEKLREFAAWIDESFPRNPTLLAENSGLAHVL